MAFVFDFVGSWHFHGPIGFHRPSAEGSWPRAKFHIDLAAQEAVLTARNSGTHNVITTLVNFESPVAWANADRGPGYGVIWDAERGQDCFEKYMHLLAFEHPRRWPIVFARAADYADYFRRTMPRCRGASSVPSRMIWRTIGSGRTNGTSRDSPRRVTCRSPIAARLP